MLLTSKFSKLYFHQHVEHSVIKYRLQMSRGDRWKRRCKVRDKFYEESAQVNTNIRKGQFQKGNAYRAQQKVDVDNRIMDKRIASYIGKNKVNKRVANRRIKRVDKEKKKAKQQFEKVKPEINPFEKENKKIFKTQNIKYMQQNDWSKYKYKKSIKNDRHKKCNCIDPCNPYEGDAQCQNAAKNIECYANICVHGDFCGNRRLSKKIFVPIQIKQTAEKGMGAFAGRDILDGELTTEYIGYHINERDMKKEYKINSEYIMQIENNHFVNGYKHGNDAICINHDCVPNMRLQMLTVNGVKRAAFFATEDIATGRELTFNYSYASSYDITAFACFKKNCNVHT